MTLGGFNGDAGHNGVLGDYPLFFSSLDPLLYVFPSDDGALLGVGPDIWSGNNGGRFFHDFPHPGKKFFREEPDQAPVFKVFFIIPVKGLQGSKGLGRG